MGRRVRGIDKRGDRTNRDENGKLRRTGTRTERSSGRPNSDSNGGTKAAGDSIGDLNAGAGDGREREQVKTGREIKAKEY